MPDIPLFPHRGASHEMGFTGLYGLRLRIRNCVACAWAKLCKPIWLEERSAPALRAMHSMHSRQKVFSYRVGSQGCIPLFHVPPQTRFFPVIACSQLTCFLQLSKFSQKGVIGIKKVLDKLHSIFLLIYLYNKRSPYER